MTRRELNTALEMHAVQYDRANRIEKERDRATDLLRGMVDASDLYDNASDIDEAVQGYFDAKRAARAFLSSLLVVDSTKNQEARDG